MINSYRQLCLVVTLLCCVAGMTYLAWYLNQQDNKIAVTETNTPNIVLQDFILTQYNQDGMRSYRLTGQEMKYYKQDINSEILQPVLAVFSDDAKQPERIDWEATSQKALMQPNRTQLTLIGNVHLMKHDSQRKDQSQQAVTTHLRTAILHIYERGARVETDQFVTMQSGAYFSSGIGLFALPRQQIFNLLDQVNSHYEPTFSP